MIRRLRARNFRQFTDLQSPAFARVNIILGPNGAGKTSIKDAISLLLSGTCAKRETGMGLDGLRSVGGPAGKKWQLDAQFIRGEQEAALSRSDAEGPRSAKQTLVESVTKVAGARARACIESGELIRLTPKERQRLLLDLVPRATITLPPGIRKAVSDLLGEDLAEIDLPDLDRLYKTAYDARTEAQRTIKAAGETDQPALPAALDGVLEPTDDLDASLSEIKELLATLRTQRDAALTKAAPSRADTSAFVQASRRASEALDRAQARVAKFPSPEAIVAQTKELAAKLKDAEETNAAIEASRRELNEQLGTATGNAKRAKAALDALADPVTKGRCPTCSYELGLQRKEKVTRDLKNAWEAAERDAQVIREKLSVTMDPLNVGEVQKQIERLESDDRARAAAVEDLGRAEAAHQAAMAALMEAEKVAELPGDVEAAQEARTLGERIAKGEEIRDALVAYLFGRKAYERALETKADAMKRHAALDQLVADLGPGGIRKSCGSAGMLEFHDRLNAALEVRGFTVDLRPAMDAEGDPLVTYRGEQLPLGEMSDGEQIAFGVAFACAVASVTGLGIVCVDNFERLDPNAHDAAMDTLEASGHQVFLFSVERDAGMEGVAANFNREMDGSTRMFLLRDGHLVAPGLGAEAAA